jgi:hypothetical protein
MIHTSWSLVAALVDTHRLCALGRKPELCSYLADMLRFYKMVDRRERSDA